MDQFTLAYIEAALWSTCDENEKYFNSDYGFSVDDFSIETLEKIIADCQKFQNENQELMKDLDPEYCGHDFWLTRNHHGAGFWDRGYGEIGDKLTEESFKYQEINLYIGDDNKIYY